MAFFAESEREKERGEEMSGGPVDPQSQPKPPTGLRELRGSGCGCFRAAETRFSADWVVSDH